MGRKKGTCSCCGSKNKTIGNPPKNFIEYGGILAKKKGSRVCRECFDELKEWTKNEVFSFN